MKGNRKLNCFCLVLLLVLPSLVSAWEKDVLKALEKIKGSAEAGATYQKYMELLTDANVEINIYNMARTQNNCFLRAVEISLLYYEAAGIYWEGKMQSEGDEAKEEAKRMQEDWQSGADYLNEAYDCLAEKGKGKGK